MHQRILAIQPILIFLFARYVGHIYDNGILTRGHLEAIKIYIFGALLTNFRFNFHTCYPPPPITFDFRQTFFETTCSLSFCSTIFLTLLYCEKKYFEFKLNTIFDKIPNLTTTITLIY